MIRVSFDRFVEIFYPSNWYRPDIGHVMTVENEVGVALRYVLYDYSMNADMSYIGIWYALKPEEETEKLRLERQLGSDLFFMCDNPLGADDDDIAASK